MKWLFVWCVFLVMFFLSPVSSAFAQAPSQVGQDLNWRTESYVPRDHKTYTQSTVIELLVSFSCLLTGIDPVDPKTPCLTVDPVSRKLGYVPSQSGGLAGLFGGMIGGMYNIPVSSHDYIAYTTSKFGVSETSYAQENPDQGVGFDALSPIVNVWVAFRNVVFIMFVIVFILIGFGIMFRLQTDKAATTLQGQLPKIVLVIILVVLSYGIAGFMIDMMYVGMYFIFEIFASIEGVRMDPAILHSSNPLTAIGGIGGLGTISADAASSIGDILATIFSGNWGKYVGMFIAGLLTSVVGAVAFGQFGFLGGLVGAAFSDEVITIVGSVIAFVIFGAALVIALFRIWFALLKSFVSVLIASVIAPLWIAAALLPASPFPLSSWFRFMIGHLLMFPTALAMFLFAFVFIQLFGKNGEAQTISFPFVGNPTDVDAFGSLIAFAVLLMTPYVLEKVKTAVGAPSTEVTSAVAGGLAAGVGLAKAPLKFTRPFLGHYRDGTPRVLQAKIDNRLKRVPVLKHLVPPVKEAQGVGGEGAH